MVKVQLIQVDNGEKVDALINSGTVSQMPSIQDGWKFNFYKQLKKLKHATGYLLVREETPTIIEGCMIFQLIDNEKPYLAYIEVAPHNLGSKKKYDHVAGCLLAYAYQLSVVKGVGDYRAYLQLTVLEENKEDERKLIKIYHDKYHARLLPGTTTMVIYDENGEKLIEEYLPSRE